MTIGHAFGQTRVVEIFFQPDGTVLYGTGVKGEKTATSNLAEVVDKILQAKYDRKHQRYFPSAPAKDPQGMEKAQLTKAIQKHVEFLREQIVQQLRLTPISNLAIEVKPVPVDDTYRGELKTYRERVSGA